MRGKSGAHTRARATHAPLASSTNPAIQDRLSITDWRQQLAQRRRRQRHALRHALRCLAILLSTDFSLFRFSPPPLWHTQPRAPTSAARVSTRLFWGGGEGMASCGGDTMTAGTFQGEMPALCGGGSLHNACMHLMTLTPQHTTSAVSRRGG